MQVILACAQLLQTVCICTRNHKLQHTTDPQTRPPNRRNPKRQTENHLQKAPARLLFPPVTESSSGPANERRASVWRYMSVIPSFRVIPFICDW